MILNCDECNAVIIDGVVNHYPYCSQWDGVKGRSVKVSSAHIDKPPWKQAAKMWWTYAKDNEQGMVERERLWREAQATADKRGELVDAVNKYRKSRLITDRKAMFELAKELDDA
jgi:hypothetical protein